jgi:hypothetical protein
MSSVSITPPEALVRLCCIATIVLATSTALP